MENFNVSEDLILIIDDEETEYVQRDGEKGVWGGQEVRRRLAEFREVRLDPSVLEARMSSFLKMVGRLFRQVDEEIGSQSSMQLGEVELSVEIGGEGEIKLVAGGKATSKGAIKMKFTRVEPK